MTKQEIQNLVDELDEICDVKFIKLLEEEEDLEKADALNSFVWNISSMVAEFEDTLKDFYGIRHSLY